jgi:hypothetical protein
LIPRSPIYAKFSAITTTKRWPASAKETTHADMVAYAFEQIDRACADLLAADKTQKLPNS